MGRPPRLSFAPRATRGRRHAPDGGPGIELLAALILMLVAGALGALQGYRRGWDDGYIRRKLDENWERYR